MQGSEQCGNEQIDEPDYRVGETQQRREYVGEGDRQAIGKAGADDFRRDFGKDQDGKGDRQRACAECPFVVAEQRDGDDADQRRRRRVDQVVEEQDDAESLSVRAAGRAPAGPVVACPVPDGAAGSGWRPSLRFPTSKEAGKDEQNAQQPEQGESGILSTARQLRPSTTSSTKRLPT